MSWLRERVRPRSASSSRLKPVSTTTSPTSARPLQHGVEDPGTRLHPAVGSRQPGEHLEAGRPPRDGTGAKAAASRLPALTSRAAASRPETSSSTPRCWATAPPCGSASTSTLGGSATRVLGGEADRERRTTRGAGGSVHRDDAARRAGRPRGGAPRPGRGSTTRSRLPARRTASGSPSRSPSGTTATTPSRTRASASPPTATHRTSSRSSCITASASSPADLRRPPRRRPAPWRRWRAGRAGRRSA